MPSLKQCPPSVFSLKRPKKRYEVRLGQFILISNRTTRHIKGLRIVFVFPSTLLDVFVILLMGINPVVMHGVVFICSHL